MRSILAIVFVMTFGWGAKVSYHSWKEGETFSNYLKTQGISLDVLKTISSEDKKFLTEIQRDGIYYELIDDDGKVLQSLIPINLEMQIHLYKHKQNDTYGFDIIPIVYEEREYFAKVKIESNPYTDTIETVKEPKIAKRLGQALKGTVNTKKLKKGDELAFTYSQKTRLGSLYAMPDIKVASIKSNNKTEFIYADEDGDGHLEGQTRTEFTKSGDFIHLVPMRDRSQRLGMPIRHVRITSKFSYRRWHPILHRYRPHNGTDFGARHGTPLLSVYDGTVSFAGRMGGYGNVIKIKHPMGYESLYAHQSRLGVKRGQRVKKGAIIGYAGNTGGSTGTHLHFGLLKGGRWVDPLKHLQQASLSKEKYSKIIIKDAKSHKENLLKKLYEDTPTFVWKFTKKSDLAIGG